MNINYLATTKDASLSNFIEYSGEHGISHANLYVIKKKLSSLSFIVIIINNEVGYA
jgi:hypothetical protein